MNKRLSSDLFRFNLLVCLLTATCGCGKKDIIGTTDTPNAVAATGKPNIVLPGVGLSDCYVGMPVKDLRGDWQEPQMPRDADPEIAKTHLENRKRGLGVKHDGTRIRSVFVYFNSDKVAPFDGEIEGEIGRDSSIEDVIRIKGQPENIAATRDEDGDSVDLWYMEQGLAYTFLNKKLNHVSVTVRLHGVVPSMKKDIGDTAAYRAIQPR